MQHPASSLCSHAAPHITAVTYQQVRNTDELEEETVPEMPLRLSFNARVSVLHVNVVASSPRSQAQYEAFFAAGELLLWSVIESRTEGHYANEASS